MIKIHPDRAPSADSSISPPARARIHPGELGAGNTAHSDIVGNEHFIHDVAHQIDGFEVTQFDPRRSEGE